MTAAAVAEPKPRVVLIDLSSIFHPAWLASEGKTQASAIQDTLSMVARCAKPDCLVAICIDSRKSWRKERAPIYKANRPPMPADFYGTLDRIKDRLQIDGYLLWEAESFEADDVIATATEEAVRRGHDVVICSADKDLMQLLRPGVIQFRTHDGSLWSEEDAEKKFGVKVSQLGDYFALTGDTSDNIPGVDGVGPENAAKALRQWGGLPSLGVALEKDIGACGRCKPKRKDDPGEPYSWAKSINAHWSDVMLSRELVDLVKTVPIRFDDIYAQRELKPLTTFKSEPMIQDSSAPEARDDEGADTIAGGQPTPGLVIPCSDPKSNCFLMADGVLCPIHNAVWHKETGTRTWYPRGQGPAAPGELPPDIKIGELVPFQAQEKRLAPVVSAQFERQLEPRDLKEAFWLAEGLYEARVYTKWTSAHAMWLAIIRGREMGFPAAVALDLFHPMEGGLALKSNTIHTLAEKLPDCEYLYCVETTATTATWETKHRKHPTPERYTYTREMAAQAGLCSLEPVPPPVPPPAKNQRDARGNWDKRCQNMVLKTARDNLIRMVYPSAASLYSVTELGGDDHDND